MLKINVFYDYHEGNLAPLWYIIFFKKGELPWDKENVYFSIYSPFQRMQMEDFLTDSQGLAVTLGELIRHSENTRKLGIYLPPLKDRATEKGVDYQDTEYLILQVADLDELLHFNLWR